jgi:hypothetical protein
MVTPIVLINILKHQFIPIILDVHISKEVSIMINIQQIYDIFKGRAYYIAAYDNILNPQYFVNNIGLDDDGELYTYVNSASEVSNLLKRVSRINMKVSGVSGKETIITAKSTYLYSVPYKSSNTVPYSSRGLYDHFGLSDIAIIKNDLWEELSPFAQFGLIDHFDPNKDYSLAEPGDTLWTIFDRYHCINIPDDAINEWWYRLEAMDTFLHSIDRPARNLARYGVTLIPPSSFELFRDVILSETIRQYQTFVGDLIKMITNASLAGKFLIHFGV